MSKNISIMEGGEARNFTVDKIRTALSPGGEAEWVPEGDFVVTDLTVNKRWRLYRAVDWGLLGFDEVTITADAVGYDGDTGTSRYPAMGSHDVSIKENGTREDYQDVHKIDTGGFGFGTRERWVYDLGQKTDRLTVTVDGDTEDPTTYDAGDESLVAYDEVFIRGLADYIVAEARPVDGYVLKPGDAHNTNMYWFVKAMYNDGGRFSTIADYLPPDLRAQVDTYDGAGRSVSREAVWTPNAIPSNWTQDTFTFTVTWARYDDNKVLTTTVTVPVDVPEDLPSYIKVVTPPTKVVYNEGETIDFTGIMVKAYRADDSLWIKSPYTDSNGVIPVADLTFPVTVAHYEDDDPGN